MLMMSSQSQDNRQRDLEKGAVRPQDVAGIDDKDWSYDDPASPHPQGQTTPRLIGLSLNIQRINSGASKSSDKVSRVTTEQSPEQARPPSAASGASAASAASAARIVQGSSPKLSLDGPPGRAGTFGLPMAVDQNGGIELDPNEPGAWAVSHHHFGLLREIVDDSDKSFIAKLQDVIGIDFTGKGPMENGPGPQNEGDGPEGRGGNEGPEESVPFHISFAEMQRMHLNKLQVKLVKHAVSMHTSRKETNDWEKDLAEYIQARKDYDYILQCSNSPEDYFVATSQRKDDRYIIRRVIKKFVPNAKDLKGRLMPISKRRFKDESALMSTRGTRDTMTRLKNLREFRDRVFLAVVGAALMLGPMWLMVLHNTLYTGLATTTVCVTAFGLIASIRLDKPSDVLSSTATYAAVLVVFVGLTTEGGR